MSDYAPEMQDPGDGDMFGAFEGAVIANFREAIEHIHGLPPVDRSAVANRPDAPRPPRVPRPERTA